MDTYIGITGGYGAIFPGIPSTRCLCSFWRLDRRDNTRIPPPFRIQGRPPNLKICDFRVAFPSVTFLIRENSVEILRDARSTPCLMLGCCIDLDPNPPIIHCHVRSTSILDKWSSSTLNILLINQYQVPTPKIIHSETAFQSNPPL